MNIIERFASNPEYSSKAPERLTFVAQPRTIYAPLAGEIVEDEVETMGLFGKGVALHPAAEIVYAPVSGRIRATTVTNHAIGITTADGIDVLMHIGIGTVSMNGRGFVRFVQAGEEVKAGDPLIAFDDQRILDAGYKDTVVVMVTNADELGPVIYEVDESVKLGSHPVVKPGELLMRVAEK